MLIKGVKRMIYLDNAATTKTAPEVVDAMIPYFTEHYGNPSSVYSFASGNKEVVSRQREIIAQALGAQANEIYFTADTLIHIDHKNSGLNNPLPSSL